LKLARGPEFNDVVTNSNNRGGPDLIRAARDYCWRLLVVAAPKLKFGTYL